MFQNYTGLNQILSQKEVFNLYENEMVLQQKEEEDVNYKDFEGLDEDWEDFNST